MLEARDEDDLMYADTRLLILKGATPLIIASSNARDEEGRDALFIASDIHPAMVNLLIQRGANVRESRSNNGRTPLMVACFSGNATIANSLLNHGALDSIDAQDLRRQTALYYTCHGGQSWITKVLLAAGADPRIPNHKGETPSEAARRMKVEFPAYANRYSNSRKNIRFLKVYR